MGRPLPDDDELLELPKPLDADDEAPGLPEAEELALAEIGDGPEEVGLDTELGALDPFEPVVDVVDDDVSVSALEDEPAAEDIVAELDAEGDESGWLDESEGSNEDWDDDFDTGEEEGFYDDGGLEGVDDPMLDSLVDVDDDPIRLDQDDEAFGDDLGEDLLREIVGEGAVSGQR